jgi:hypothetical protein
MGVFLAYLSLPLFVYYNYAYANRRTRVVHMFVLRSTLAQTVPFSNGALTRVAHMFVLRSTCRSAGALTQLGGTHVRVEVNVGNGAVQQRRTHLGGAHVHVEVNVGNGAAQQKAFRQMPVRRR